MAKTPNGNEIKTYNPERTICDILRSRNQMDIQFINQALKRYVRKKERNTDLLYSYAQQFRIQNLVPGNCIHVYPPCDYRTIPLPLQQANDTMATHAS